MKYSSVYRKQYSQSEGGNGCNGSPERDRDTGLCWDRVVVQNLWPLKINNAGLKPKPLSERKSGLEVREAMSQITFLAVGSVCRTSEERQFVLFKVYRIVFYRIVLDPKPEM